ncbi:MAG: hypothetical protein P8X47_09075 [Ignavibacteriaceae bacterium]
MKLFYIIIFLFLLLVSGCKTDELVNELTNSEITAKSEVGGVISTARTNFTNDANLTAIYGLNVNNNGKVDLLKPTDNAFIYVVQSDSDQTNEFYVPVFNSSPVKSPVNFNDMLSLVKDAQAKNILGFVFGKLSTIHIDPSVNYADSPDVLSKMFARSDVTSFRTLNSGVKTDMFLIPSKSIDTTNVNNSADWIVNFYSDNTSLVLWLHPGTTSGAIDILSGN